MPEEVERGRIRPVDVVDDEEYGLPLPHLEEELAHRSVEAVALGVRIGGRRGGKRTESDR
jgi:hypothetical protein